MWFPNTGIWPQKLLQENPRASPLLIPLSFSCQGWMLVLTPLELSYVQIICILAPSFFLLISKEPSSEIISSRGEVIPSSSSGPLKMLAASIHLDIRTSGSLETMNGSRLNSTQQNRLFLFWGYFIN